MPESEIDAIKLIRSCEDSAKVIEIRLDLKPDIDLTYIANAINKPIIATCLAARDGGKFAGSLKQLADVLLNAARHKIQYLTVNHYLLEKFPFNKIPRSVKIIAAYHNPRSTPKSPGKIVKEMARTRPAVLKFASRANNLNDNLKLLGIRSRKPFIGLCMGENGVPSRILYKKFNSWLTFGHPSDTQPSAEGQLSVKTLSEVYKADKINAKTRLYALFGKPVNHSAGPNLFNFQFEQQKMNAAYVPFQVNNAREIVTAMKKFDIQGASITAPFKTTIIPYLDEVCRDSEIIGAVNTVVRRGNRLIGHNTDWAGFQIALLEDSAYQGLIGRKTPPTVLVLGAGGAARAIIYALKELINPNIFVYNRTTEKARTIVKRFKCSLVDTAGLKDLKPDIIVNATSAGMNLDNSLPIEAEFIPQGSYVFDAIYNPPETPLIKLAKEKNCRTQSGLNMFLFQAHHQLMLWGLK